MPRGSEAADAFRVHAVPAGANLFPELAASIGWEDVGRGRRGAVLTLVDAGGGVPLVRTTARYTEPAQRFRPVHERLAQLVREGAGLSVPFNHALVERYTSAYRKMGGHSDQALDLAEGTSIAVFSCYRDPAAGPPRTLVVEAKAPGGEPVRIPMVHHTAVVFSVAANRRFRHRIVLEAPGGASGAADHEWLGVTFRTSRTSVHYRDGAAFLAPGQRLALADEEERQEFLRLRRRENTETDFGWPPLGRTVSASDLLPPV